MSMMISIHDGLARRLEAEAINQSVSVEELAIRILDNAVSASPHDNHWGKRNQRRLELIRKSTQGDLTEAEQAELDELQSVLDKEFESFDKGLLRRLDEMKQAVAEAIAEDSHE